MKKHGNLVLVRHGESQWNLLNLFTGWIDVPLSDNGIRESHQCAKHCEKFDYNTAFTSNLGRAQEMLLIILSHQRRLGIIQHKKNSRYHQLTNMPSKLMSETLPIIISEKLNERAYGDLQGMNKKTANSRFGKSQVFKWRRGFEERPPKGESLKDTFLRVTPYFKKEIHPRIIKGETILIVGHGNTLRAIIKFLEKISDEKISLVDLPTGKPIVYNCKNSIFTRIEGAYGFDRPLR